MRDLRIKAAVGAKRCQEARLQPRAPAETNLQLPSQPAPNFSCLPSHITRFLSPILVGASETSITVVSAKHPTLTDHLALRQASSPSRAAVRVEPQLSPAAIVPSLDSVLATATEEPG